METTNVLMHKFVTNTFRCGQKEEPISTARIFAPIVPSFPSKSEKQVLIFDLFICVPILPRAFIFGINILWKNRKLICFLFTVCLHLPRFVCLSSLPFEHFVWFYWKVCFSLNFEWNVIIRDFLSLALTPSFSYLIRMKDGTHRNKRGFSMWSTGFLLPVKRNRNSILIM